MPYSQTSETIIAYFTKGTYKCGLHDRLIMNIHSTPPNTKSKKAYIKRRHLKKESAMNQLRRERQEQSSRSHRLTEMCPASGKASKNLKHQTDQKEKTSSVIQDQPKKSESRVVQKDLETKNDHELSSIPKPLPVPAVKSEITCEAEQLRLRESKGASCKVSISQGNYGKWSTTVASHLKSLGNKI